MDQAFAEAAHRNGLSQKQFDGIFADVVGSQALVHQANLQSMQESQDGLRQEWGYTFDDRNTAVAAMLGQTEAPSELIEAVQNQGLGGDTIKWLYGIVQRFGGEIQVAGQGAGASDAMTPAEAEAQIQEIMGKPEYRHHDLSIRQPWIDKVQGLMRYAVPDALHGAEAANDLRR